jgi:flagellar hook-basal body complex protein FliE
MGMNNIDVNQILTQMRVLEAQAQGVTPSVEEGAKTSFGDLLQKSIDGVNEDLLQKSIDGVNETQQKAGALKEAFEMGDRNVDLAEVMIAVQKSSVSFQAMVQVRNKLVEAYKDVMNMPI